MNTNINLTTARAKAGQASYLAREIPARQEIAQPNLLEALKDRLVAELLSGAKDDELVRRLKRAADESAALAWASTFPLLTLPELIGEKAREARRQFDLQRLIQSRGRSVVRMAA